MLKELRHRAGLSQEYVAKHLGLQLEEYIRLEELNQKKLDDKIVEGLIDLYGIEMLNGKHE